MSVYHTARDYTQHFITLHDIADDFDNKRSVSEIICGAEPEVGTSTRRSLSGFKIQGSLYISSEGSVLSLLFPPDMTKLAIHFILLIYSFLFSFFLFPFSFFTVVVLMV